MLFNSFIAMRRFCHRPAIVCEDYSWAGSKCRRIQTPFKATSLFFVVVSHRAAIFIGRRTAAMSAASRAATCSPGSLRSLCWPWWPTLSSPSFTAWPRAITSGNSSRPRRQQSTTADNIDDVRPSPTNTGFRRIKNNLGMGGWVRKESSIVLWRSHSRLGSNLFE